MDNDTCPCCAARAHAQTAARVANARAADLERDAVRMRAEIDVLKAECAKRHRMWREAHEAAQAERDSVVIMLAAAREPLAAYAHEAWAGWKEYEFSKGTFNADGTWTMPAWAVERWTRQMQTPYDELPEAEKASDRAEADKMLAIVAQSARAEETR